MENKGGNDLTAKTYSEVWDLDVFFEGGSSSPALRAHLDEVAEKMKALDMAVETFQIPTTVNGPNTIVSIIESLKDVALNLSQARAVIGCFVAADTTDKNAILYQGETVALGARFSTSLLKIQQKLASSDDHIWKALMQSVELKEFAYILTEWREEVSLKLSEGEESLITALSVDGYHGWGELYDQLVGDIKITIQIDGENKTFSVGQAANLVHI